MGKIDATVRHTYFPGMQLTSLYLDELPCSKTHVKDILNLVWASPSVGLRGYARMCPYLCHQSVSVCVLLVFKDDVGIIVGNQFLKPLRIPRYFAFVFPAGSKGFLGNVGDELLVSQRG